MEKVPRHLFVSEALRFRAYEDASLPIGYGQTVSRPSTVARMIQSLDLTGGEKVLEIGTGSGYQSALLAEMAEAVVTVERIEELYRRAREILLMRMNYKNITLRHTGRFEGVDGTFDAIIVSAGASVLPVELFALLVDRGILVIPVGNEKDQRIKRYKRCGDAVKEDDLGRALFVPLVREGTA